jgi:hypothetical protein
MVEALRKAKDLEGIMQEHGTLLGHLLGEDAIMRVMHARWSGQGRRCAGTMRERPANSPREPRGWATTGAGGGCQTLAVHILESGPSQLFSPPSPLFFLSYSARFSSASSLGTQPLAGRTFSAAPDILGAQIMALCRALLMR